MAVTHDSKSRYIEKEQHMVLEDVCLREERHIKDLRHDKACLQVQTKHLHLLERLAPLRSYRLCSALG